MHEHQGGHTNHGRQPVALTPRPIRLLLIGRIKPGAEQKLREAQARFPHDAANGAGIDAAESFFGQSIDGSRYKKMNVRDADLVGTDRYRSNAQSASYQDANLS